MNIKSINLLKEVFRGNTDRKDLMRILGLKKSQFSDIVKDLEEEYYVRRIGSGISLQINLKTNLLKKIMSKFDLEKILRDSNEKVLLEILEPIEIQEIERRLNLSKGTVYSCLSDLESIGVLKRDKNIVQLDVSNNDLWLFASVLKKETEDKSVEPESQLIYGDSKKTIKQVKKGMMVKGELTAFSLFSDYGIQYETINDYYVEQQTPLILEEVLIHSVLVATKLKDKNLMLMSTVFYLKHKTQMDPLTIRKIAREFGIIETWLDVEGYVRGLKLKNPDLFPSNEELNEKAILYDIPNENYLLPQGYPKLFQDISKELPEPISVYLFGGENMRLKGLKSRTKDCDVAVTEQKSFDLLLKALKKIGYNPLVEVYFSSEDKRINPSEIMVHPKRSRMDIFETQVCNALYISDRMKKQAEIEKFGKLSFGKLRNEHVFLLKAMTTREGDIQDLASIVRAGNFDWKLVWDELIAQEHELGQNRFSLLFLDSMDLLQLQYGIKPPFYRKLVRHVIDNQIKNLIRNKEISLKELVSLLEGGDVTETIIRNRVDALAKEKFLKKISKKDGVYLKQTIKTVLNIKSDEPVNTKERLLKHIRMVSKRLDLPLELTQDANKIIEIISQDQALQGRNLRAVAASLIHLLCIQFGIDYGPKVIAKELGITQGVFSLRKILQPMVERIYETKELHR